MIGSVFAKDCVHPQNETKGLLYFFMLLAFLTNTALANTLPVFALTQYYLKNMFKHKATTTAFHYIFLVFGI